MLWERITFFSFTRRLIVLNCFFALIFKIKKVQKSLEHLVEVQIFNMCLIIMINSSIIIINLRE